MFPILALGFVMGLQHAMEADHLAAVATIASRQAKASDILKHGLTWGLGHTLTLLALAGVALLLGNAIPDRLANSLEFAVGVMLLFLGAHVLWRLWRERVHAHVHRHEDRLHLHLHKHDAGLEHSLSHVAGPLPQSELRSHAAQAPAGAPGEQTHAGPGPGDFAHAPHALDHAAPASSGHAHAQHALGDRPHVHLDLGLHAHGDHAHDHPHLGQGFRWRTLFVGLMHGMAGSAALLLLAMAQVRDPIRGVAYILVFGLGSMVGMGALSLLIAVPLTLSARFLTWANRGLQGTIGVATMGLGVATMLSHWP